MDIPNTATFYARAASSRNLKAYVGQTSDPYDIFNTNYNFSLTTNWQTYTFTFTMSYPTENSTATFGFDFGTSDVDVYLDNISLVDVTTTDVESVAQTQIVRTYDLFQNYPNPFNPTTTIRYQVPEPCFVSLKVYDLLGREAATLVNEENVSGAYEVRLDGASLPSGMYIYQLRAGEFIKTKKLLLQK